MPNLEVRCFSCGIIISAGAFCNQTCRDTAKEWARQKQDYDKRADLTQIEKYLIKYDLVAV